MLWEADPGRQLALLAAAAAPTAARNDAPNADRRAHTLADAAMLSGRVLDGNAALLAPGPQLGRAARGRNWRSPWRALQHRPGDNRPRVQCGGEARTTNDMILLRTVRALSFKAKVALHMDVKNINLKS